MTFSSMKFECTVISFLFVDIILHEILSIEWTKFYSRWQYFIVKYCPGQNFIIKFNEILSMDHISYEILSHGHFHRGQYFMIHIYTWTVTYVYNRQGPARWNAVVFLKFVLLLIAITTTLSTSLLTLVNYDIQRRAKSIRSL